MKILFTGNLFHNYEQDICEGLEALGHEVDMRFNSIHGPSSWRLPKTIPQWFFYGVLKDKLGFPAFYDAAVARYNRDLQQMMRRSNYDLLIVIGAKTIYPETIAQFKGPKVFWFMDGLPRYQYVLPKVPLFDHLFVFEPTDRQVIRDYCGRDSEFLTLAFSPKRYYKKQLPVKRDFSFVGAMYPKREEYLRALLSVSSDIAVAGDFHKSSDKALRSKVVGFNISSSAANDLYCSSKINVNIHHAQSKEGMAIRTFEIIGAGGFEIMERQKGALLFFEEDRHMAFYDSKEEFLDKCRYYLDHDSERSRIADTCHKLALQRHTWKARFEDMFRMMPGFA